MNMQGFLNRNNKKKDLSSDSKEEGQRKSLNVLCLDCSMSPDNVFAESLKWNEYVEILMNCLKNLEKK